MTNYITIKFFLVTLVRLPPNPCHWLIHGAKNMKLQLRMVSSSGQFLCDFGENGRRGDLLNQMKAFSPVSEKSVSLKATMIAVLFTVAWD